MSSSRGRARRPARRDNSRTPKQRILVVCEGKKTEPQYLTQFAAAHRVNRVEVVITPDAGVPLSVVQKAQKLHHVATASAKREGDSFLTYDAVWCVFDVDEHPNLAQAVETARQSGLQVAVSNPCFELWLVLHHREPPGLIHRHDVQKLLKTFVADYDKNVSYQHHSAGYELACQRARRLDKLAEDVGDPGRNPSTGVYRLTESIARPPQPAPEPPATELAPTEPSVDHEAAAPAPKEPRAKGRRRN